MNNDLTNPAEDELIPPADPTPVILDGVDDVIAPVGEPEAVVVPSEDDVIAADSALFSADAEKKTADEPTDIMFSETEVDFRGESLEAIGDLIRIDSEKIGVDALQKRVREIGSWENIVYRAYSDVNFEEEREQQAMAELTKEDREQMKERLLQDGKTVLRTTPLGGAVATGEVQVFSGDAARLAFECNERGGGYRMFLANSGIAVDLTVPTGTEIQTMLVNCLSGDRQMGSAAGAHYFTYNDVLNKQHVINFIYPLILNTSYLGWRKQSNLLSLIKITDLPALVMTIAALCYQDGFDQFRVKCTNPKTELCRHTETIKADLFKMIVTRWGAMNPSNIEFLMAARANKSHSLAQIAKYQEELNLEGERLTFGDVTFTMKIPTIQEYMDAGSQFLAEIINDIEADDVGERVAQMENRYIRTFIPWIATVEKAQKSAPQGGAIKTAELDIIRRELEKLDDKDKEGSVAKALRHYVNKVQLTYVGFPVLPCSKCGHTADTPSGLWTIDPFNTFFTLALLYLNPAS